jgi:hypothetical protein
LEPLSVVASEKRGQHGETTLCSFEHFLNLLWRPLIDFIEACDRGIDLQWTESLGLHEKALLSEMQGVLASADKALDMDAWVAFIQKTLLRLLQIQVPTRLIMQVVSPVVPLSLQTTPANALHLLRSSLCSKLVGPAVAAQADRMILAEIAEVPVKLFSEQEVNLGIRRDLIASLEQQHCGCEVEEDITENKPCKKLRKDTSSKQDMLGSLTKQVLWMLENRVAVSRVSDTVQCSSAGADLDI